MQLIKSIGRGRNEDVEVRWVNWTSKEDDRVKKRSKSIVKEFGDENVNYGV